LIEDASELKRKFGDKVKETGNIKSGDVKTNVNIKKVSSNFGSLLS